MLFELSKNTCHVPIATLRATPALATRLSLCRTTNTRQRRAGSQTGPRSQLHCRPSSSSSRETQPRSLKLFAKNNFITLSLRPLVLTGIPPADFRRFSHKYPVRRRPHQFRWTSTPMSSKTFSNLANRRQPRPNPQNAHSNVATNALQNSTTIRFGKTLRCKQISKAQPDYRFAQPLASLFSQILRNSGNRH
jgi:hypothetical protein